MPKKLLQVVSYIDDLTFRYYSDERSKIRQLLQIARATFYAAYFQSEDTTKYRRWVKELKRLVHEFKD